MSRVVIFTRLTALPGERDELLAALDELGVATRAEPGNEAFVVHPARDEPDVVLGYEVFRRRRCASPPTAPPRPCAWPRERLDDLLAAPPEITYALD